MKRQASPLALDSFCDKVWEQGAKLYRDLPWRNTRDPYGILVSEVMLQQTQVTRVLKYWETFLAMFPTVDALAAADSAIVLERWQGLGYNRRALALKKTAEICSEANGGKLPEAYDDLIALPGIGEATAAGIRAFAYGLPGVYLETNVRTVFIHELFADAEKVSDRELKPLIEATCPRDRARDWYYALLDYGAHLKTGHANPSRKSAHHAKQSAFEGSRRQKRAEMLRMVLAAPGVAVQELLEMLNAHETASGRQHVDRCEFESIVADMVAEGFFRLEGDSLFA